MRKAAWRGLAAFLFVIILIATAIMLPGCMSKEERKYEKFLKKWGIIEDVSMHDASRRDSDYFSMSNYYVEVDIGSNRTAKITETITLTYWYYFTRYLPTSEETPLESATIYELVSDKNGETSESEVDYRVFYEDGCIVLDVGDDDYKNEEHTYVVTYEYSSLPYAIIDGTTVENSLAVSLLGDRWEYSLKNINVVINLPTKKYEVLNVFSGSPDDIYSSYTSYTVKDNMLTFSLSSLTYGKALNFYFRF